MALDLSKSVKAEDVLASNVDEIKENVLAGKTPDAKANRVKKVLFAIMDNSGLFVSKEARNLAADLTLDSELANIIGYVKAGETPKAGTFFGKRPAEKKDASGKVTNSASSVKYDTIATVVENANNHDYRISERDIARQEAIKEEQVNLNLVEDVDAAWDAAIKENAEFDKRVLDSAWDEAIKENAEFDMRAKESRSAAKVFAENKEINELQKVKRSSSVRTIVLGSVAALGLIGTVVGSSIAAVRGNIIKEQESVIENYDQLTNEMLNKASEILKDYQVTNEYALPVVGINEAGNRVAENDPSAVKHAFVISTGDQARVAREYVSVLTEEGYKKYNADNISEFTVKDFESAGDAYRFAMGVNDVVITNTAKYYAEALEKIDNPEDLTIAVNGAEMTIKNLRDSYVTIFNEHSKCATDIAGLQMQIDELAQNLEASDAEKKEMEATILVYKETEQNLSAQLIEKGEIIANLQKQLEEANEKLAQWETKLPEQGDESTSGGNNSGIIVDDSNKNENSGIDKGESDSSNSEWNFGA